MPKDEDQMKLRRGSSCTQNALAAIALALLLASCSSNSSVSHSSSSSTTTTKQEPNSSGSIAIEASTSITQLPANLTPSLTDFTNQATAWSVTSRSLVA